MAHDVFISHSVKDKTTADLVCAMLERESFRCWVAPRDILPGVAWGTAIMGAIKASRVMVVIFSSDANASPQVMREVERAVTHGVILIPFRIEDVKPSDAMEYFLSSPHWLDALSLPLEAHVRTLVETVRRLLHPAQAAPAADEEFIPPRFPRTAARIAPAGAPAGVPAGATRPRRGADRRNHDNGHRRPGRPEPFPYPADFASPADFDNEEGPAPAIESPPGNARGPARDGAASASSHPPPKADRFARVVEAPGARRRSARDGGRAARVFLAVAFLACAAGGVYLWQVLRPRQVAVASGPRQGTTPATTRAITAAPLPAPSPLVPPATAPSAGPRTMTNSLEMRLVEIKPGAFLMGSPDDEPLRYPDEARHKVVLTRAFFLAAHEVTRRQFAAFAEGSGYQTDAERAGTGFVVAGSGGVYERPGLSWRAPGFEQGDDHPAVYLSWNDAVAFCRWLSEKENRTYRLPTEAEWEYAARAGATTVYPWGDQEDGGQHYCNAADAKAKEHFPNWVAFEWSDGFVFTAPVGSFEPNRLGLYDMIGNAWEWCDDWYGEYPRGPVADPAGPADGRQRVMRGGSWNVSPRFCRCANRRSFAPDRRFDFTGFRVALTPEPAPEPASSN